MITWRRGVLEWGVEEDQGTKGIKNGWCKERERVIGGKERIVGKVFDDIFGRGEGGGVWK